MNAACLAPPFVVLDLLAPGRLGAACRTVLSGEAGAADVTLAAYALVFLANCLLEAPAYGVFAHIMGRSRQAALGQIIGLNLATHPAVYFVFPSLAESLGWSLLTQVSVSEIFAFAVEAALLRGIWAYPWRSAVLASALANLSSWWAGAYLSESGLLP
jgi:hypothetical protein